MSAKRRALLRRALRVECLEERIPLAYGATSLVSVNSAGSAAGNEQSYLSDQTLSADGRYYVFASDASNIVAGDTNGTRDVFMRDLKLGTVALVSRTAANATSNGLSDQPVISADGMYVAFSSAATNLNFSGAASANGNQQVYRWERTTGQIRLVSLNASGSDGGNALSSSPSISGNGGRIAFETYADDLLTGVSDGNSAADVYLRDLGAAAPATFLVSHTSALPLVTANGYATAAQISRDGSRVFYRSSSTDMQSGVTDINVSSEDLIAYDVLGANAGTNKYVSLQTTSVSTANQASVRTYQSLSSDGQWEVFSSDASDLVSGDTNGQRDVFLRNLQTGTISVVSQGANGALLEPANGYSDVAAISADGNFVAFVSYATNLKVTVGPNSTNGIQQVYRWDRVNNLLSLISRNAANSDGGNAVSYQPSLNQTGSRVAYASDATDLQTGVVDNNATTDVYIRDVTAGTTKLVSHAASSLLVTGTGYAYDAHISRDGSRVVYRSTSGDLQTGVTDLNTVEDLVSYNVTGVSAGANQYVNLQTTLPTTGNQASARTSHSLSADGLWEVFSSDASDLVSGDTNGQRDVFVRNLQTGVVTLVSQGASGPANSSSDSAVISADGNFVAFTSYATNLKVPVGPNSVNGSQQVYRWDRVNNRLSLISRNSASSDGGNNASYQPSINQTGSRVAYASDATDLQTGGVDNNVTTDVYIHDVTAGTTKLVSHAASSLLITSAGYAYDALISRDGSRVTYRSTSGDLQTGVTDVNNTEDLVSYNVSSGANQYVSLESAAPTTGNQGSSRTEQSLSSDGQWEVFSSDASDLVAGDTNGSTDVFLRNLTTGVTTLVSKTISGVSANSTSNQAVISANGNFVAFSS